MHLVQVCNVGQICGGTAACAWTIRKALPNWRHTQLCLSTASPEMRSAFQGTLLRDVSRLDNRLLAELRPDLLILHNTSPGRVQGALSCRTLSYLHSAGIRQSADATLACSQWLARQQPHATQTLYQPVPIAPRPDRARSRHLDDSLVLGRICTPTMQKWPAEAVSLAERISTQFPGVRWELVGCPETLQAAWQAACQGRVRFLPAGWDARRHLWNWDVLLYHHPRLTESFGRTAAEAMRVGCIPVVDARGGFLEQMTSGETGFLCGNQDEFLLAIEVLHDRAARRRMSRQAKSAADQQFSLRTFAQRFYEILGRCRRWEIG
jgi:hypothetical protein